jgi:hypothetical protein
LARARLQTGTELIAREHESNKCQPKRVEQLEERCREVSDHRCTAGSVNQINRYGVNGGDSLPDERSEEVIEVGEVPVQDALGDTGLIGDGSTRETCGPVAKQHSFAGGEKLRARVAQCYSGGHCGRPLSEWASAH